MLLPAFGVLLVNGASIKIRYLVVDKTYAYSTSCIPTVSEPFLNAFRDSEAVTCVVGPGLLNSWIRTTYFIYVDLVGDLWRAFAIPILRDE
ncbi:hypothetical protein BDV24DRAFT_38451 [Aspergillus arachidicola]|uniref:Uncharacterized protein n=1 Tax=Aspergillus arachidicola TaxID=656916 RepID=A0A5N6XMT0_9EURO|nr:hypothetical protein BDV24DRAFT_38451 [Aspergillus arachidicola]